MLKNTVDYISPALFGLMVLSAGWLHQATWNQPPSHHHAWSQADYYAMALQFADGPLDIFHPRTYNLQTKDGVTASDLPLPAFVSGLWMRWLGVRAPWVFRLLTLLVCMAGFMRLFWVMRKQGDVQAALWILLCWFLPTLTYFQTGFIPSVWAFSAQLFGMAALLQYASAPSVRHWTWAVVWIAVAALLRKPHVLYLALMPVFLFRRPSWRREGLIWLACMTVWSGWQWWDRHLMSAYGSLFLRHFMPPESIGEVIKVVPAILGKWIGNWFAWGHLLALAPAIALLIRRKNATPTAFSGQWALGWFLVGCFYFLLMLRQFWDHDYYVLDAFYPAYMVFVVWLNARIRLPRWALWVLAGFVGLSAWQSATAYRAFFVDKTFSASELTNLVYDQSRDWVGERIPADSTVMVFEAYSFNRPLIAIDRRGYCLLSSKKEAQENVLARNPAYALCLDTFFVSEVLQDNPRIADRLERVAENGLIRLFKVLPTARPSTPGALLGIPPEREQPCRAEGAREEFLAAQTLSPGVRQALWYGEFRADTPTNLKATAALFKNGQLVWIGEQPLQAPQASAGVFKAVRITIPDLPADELRCYLWNPDKKALYFQGYFGSGKY